jgi:hypothetical protein
MREARPKVWIGVTPIEFPTRPMCVAPMQNEIMQSARANRTPFVNVWLHNSFVRVNEEKRRNRAAVLQAAGHRGCAARLSQACEDLLCLRLLRGVAFLDDLV